MSLVHVSPGYEVEDDFAPALKAIGLDSVDAIFAFAGGQNLSKANLAAHRSRIRFEIANPAVTLFLKRYDNVPVLTQIRNWLSHRRGIGLGVPSGLRTVGKSVMLMGG